MVPHRRTSENRWNADSFVELRRYHTRSRFEGCHFGKFCRFDFLVKGVGILGGLKALISRGSETELSSASPEAELMETLVVKR